MTDEKIVIGISRGGKEREQALHSLFHDQALRNMVISYVIKHQGSEPDGMDVFQEAVILFDRNLRAGRFQGKSSLHTYFIGIAKWVWVGRRRKFNGEVLFDPAQHDGREEQTPEVRIIEGEKRKTIDAVLEQIGEKCRDLLTLYKLSYSMEEIARQLKISSPEQARRDAYRCRKKFRDYVTERPELMKTLNLT